jgi:hypothetical protein
MSHNTSINSDRVWRPISEPIRANLDWDSLWKGPDGGLIWCWERGRQKALEDPSLAQRAISGELVVLAWEGGVERKLKEERKRGTLFYLATLQGLRGEDLNIASDREVEITCTKTKQTVVFGGVRREAPA